MLSGVVLPGRGPAAEQQPGYRPPADPPAPPAPSGAPVPNEGLGIFGGVATTEATDDPPPRDSARQARRRPRRGEAAPPPPAASAAAEEKKPRSFGLLRGLLGGGAPDDAEPRMSVRELPPDVQLRLWRVRLIIMVVVGAVFAVLTRSWEVALTLAILAGIADTVYRSRNAANYRNGAQPGARRRTSRQLAKMRREGYFSVEGRHIPGSTEIIDHLVVGPSGVYAIDSEKWDPKLPIRTLNGKRLYLGPESQKDRLDHAAWEAAQASAVLSEALGSEIPVRPALAIFGPKIPWDIATIRNVDVFTGQALRKYLKRRGRKKDGVVLLTREEVRTIYDTASRLLPDVGAQTGSYTPVG